MQSRAWRLSSVMGVILLAAPSFLMAAPPKFSANRSDIDSYMATQKSAMESADADAALKIRQEIESGLDAATMGGAPSSSYAMDYVESATKAFGGLITSGKPQIRLAATVLLADLSRFNEATDLALTDALNSDLPAVRYWAAKGYTEIIPKYVPTPTLHDGALQKIRTALKKETETLVKAQLYRTLKDVNDLSPATGEQVINDLKTVVDGMQKQAPTPTTLKTVLQGFEFLKNFVEKGGSITNAERTLALRLSADASSLAVQHLMVAVDKQDDVLLNVDNLSATYRMVRKAYELDNKLLPAAQLNFRGTAPNIAKPEEWVKEFSLRTNELFGSPRMAGKLQQAAEEVGNPSAISQ